MILFLIYAAIAQQCQVLNEQFNQLVIVNREFYRLPIYNYFSGEGLTYTSDVANFNVINTLNQLSTQQLKQNGNIVANAVQNNLGDTNVQSYRFAALVNNTNQYTVYYGQPSQANPQEIFYNVQSLSISSPSTTGQFWCSSVEFIFKTNVVVSCIVATQTAATQYFYFLDYTQPSQAAVQTTGTTFTQLISVQSFYSKLQTQTAALLTTSTQTTYYIGVINTNNNGNAYYSQYLQYSLSAVPVAKTVLTVSQQYSTVSNQVAYVDFYISTVGIVFLLQNTGGLYVYNGKQTATVYNPEPSYLALAVYEIQILQTNPVYQLAIGSQYGIVSVTYNPYATSQNFVVSQYIPTQALVNQYAQLYLSPQYIVVQNGNLSVYPGPDNEINNNNLLAAIDLNGTFSAFNIFANLIVVGSQTEQYIYVLSNPLIYTTTVNTNGQLNITATDVLGSTCSLTFVYQAIASTSNQIYPTTSTTNAPSFDLFYPLSTTINFNQMFTGPALVYSYNGRNIQVNSVPIIQYGDTITYIENFYDPAGFAEEAILQVTIDSSNRISFYQTNLQQQTKTLIYQTAVYTGITQPITQIDVGFNGVNYIFGILTQSQNLYVFEFNKVNPIQQTSTSNIAFFRIISNYIYIINKSDMIVYLSSNFVTPLYTYSLTASTFNPQLFSNQLAYGELLFLTTGQSIIIFKTTLNQMEILNTITIANNYIFLEIGLTNWGIYALTAQSGLSLNLVFYPREMIFSNTAFKQTVNPITLPTFGFTLKQLTGSTYNYCYVTATNATGNFLLTYQNSPTLYGTLYFVYPISAIQFATTDPISAVGWKQYDAIVFTVSSTSPVNLQLFSQSNQVINSTQTTSVKVSQAISVGATSQVSNSQATNSLNIQTYNFVSYNQAIDELLSPNISQTGLYTVDPKQLFYGNILSYNIQNSTFSSYTTNFSNPLIVYPQQQVPTYNHFTGSTQIMYKNRVTTLILQNNTVIFSQQDYTTSIKASSSINYNISSTCGFIFTEFYTGNPITICQNSTTIPMLTFFMYNVTTKNQVTYNFSIPTGFTFVTGQYLGGVLVIILKNSTDNLIIPGLFYASTYTNSLETQQMLFSPTQNSATGITQGFISSLISESQYTALNISLQENLQVSSLLCANYTQYCSISYGIAALTLQGTLTLYTYTTTLGTETLSFYQNPNTTQLIPLTPLNPTNNPNTYTPNLQTILGDDYVANAQYYGIAQSNNNTYYENIPAIPIVITTQYGSYVIDLFISSNVYYQASLSCLLVGYEYAQPNQAYTTQSPIFGSTVASSGLVAVTYIVNSTENTYIVMSYGNITEQCAEYGYATVIQGYQFNKSGYMYQNILLGAQFPQLILPIPQNPVIQFTDKVYITFTPNGLSKSPSTTLYGQNLSTVLYAYPLTNATLDLKLAASTNLTFLYPEVSQGQVYTRDVDYDNAIWISILALFLLAVIGFLCYKSNSKQFQPDQQGQYIEV